MNFLTEEPVRKQAHIQVYEKLYKMLTDGTFPVGSKLPTEPKLAKMFDVSRMTLRQALALLHDDGLLNKIHGSGNYVTDRKNPIGVGLENIGNPMSKISKIEFDEINTEYYIQTSNDYEKEILCIDTPVVVVIHTYYKKADKLIGYTFGVTAVETISKFHLDLNNKQEIIDFFSNGIYQSAKRGQLKIYPSSAGSTIIKEFFENGAHVSMIQEKLYTEELGPIICNKHYILAENAIFEFNI